ncbi:MAG: biopolymer transport protein ExbB, partial [Pseudomonadota bacterium]|nr:biopolymer transport protein ExbB [Pseudomonadota bacterium]
MENTLGFAHFLTNADGIARFVLALMLIASIVTWYLIVTKGIHGFRIRRKSAAFLAAFWEAPNLEAVAARI